MPDDIKKNIDSFILSLQGKGRYSFSLDEAQNSTHKTSIAVKRELDRLKGKGQLVAVRKGYYVIVPPEYRQRGLMPPELFIDPMMKWMDKPYYLGLLTAASMHGSAHQQPQEVFVITPKPALRNIEKKGYRIRYITNQNWIEEGVAQKKTDTGYINISSPELTVIDLVTFYKAAGGLNRVAAIIGELLDEINESRLKKLLQANIQTTTIQRLGYIVDVTHGYIKIAGAIKKVLDKKKTFWVNLHPGTDIQDDAYKNNDWKIIENITLETDL